MGKLGQKIERVDNATKEIMDEIRDYFWHEHNIELEEFVPNSYYGKGKSADDEVYSIIHNQLKKTI